MKIDDLQAEWAYESVIAALRNPMRLPQHVGAPPRSQAKRPLVSLLDIFRKRQVDHLVKLAQSPVLEEPTTLHGNSVENKREELKFSARTPRRVARLFIAEVIRRVRASGIENVEVAQGSPNLSHEDRLFALTLQWLASMESRSQKAREPVYMWLSHREEEVEGVKWSESVGPVLGWFMYGIVVPGDGEKRLEGSQERSAIELQHAFSAAKVEIGWNWLDKLGREGASRLDELGGIAS